MLAHSSYYDKCLKEPYVQEYGLDLHANLLMSKVK